jgi:selenocysteine lyase/cysteine desulfurase
MNSSTVPTASLAVPADFAAIREDFAGRRGYLSACTTGLPPRQGRAALIAAVEEWASGRIDMAAWTRTVEECRRHFAALVGVDAGRIAIGSQVSVFVGLLAAAVPRGAEVLCADQDFSSVILPFVHTPGVSVRTVPLDALADEITDRTWLVSFSLVQSATGAVADADAITAAAERHGALTLCDATQAAGWLRVDAGRFDAALCHAYKWLCTPRGVAFAALSERLQAMLHPSFAGWYAGADPWTSCYGADVALAEDASRFDVSPAWQAFAGAEPALALFGALPAEALHARTTGLADAFRTRLGLDRPLRATPIVTWSDPDGDDLATLTAAGIVASGRAGRARVAFHVFNDEEDVERAADALTR